MPDSPSAHKPLEAALSHDQAKSAYGYLAGPLAIVSRYEALATRRLIEHGAFRDARSVFEFGCGTGQFAFELLRGHLPAEARYVGVDVTPRMVEMSQKRLAAFGGRAQVKLSAGEPPRGERPGSYDRFVATFVLDLLPDAEMAGVLRAAYDMLQGGGLLCLASLAAGTNAVSRRIMRVWELVYHAYPSAVGGCRPIRLEPLIDARLWSIEYNAMVAPLAVPLEVMVARKR